MSGTGDVMQVDGVLGERLRWLLGQIRRGPEAAELQDTSSHLKSEDPKGFFEWLSGQMGGFEVVAATRESADLASVRVDSANGRRWVLQVRLESQEPYRIEWVDLDRALLDGMEVREATEADAPGIREVCRNAPIVLRDHTVTIDPGPSYWDAIRLMEVGATVLVVTHHDRVVAVHCGTSYPIRYGGQPQWMSQILHSRVLGDYAGLGLWSVMNRRLVNAANVRRQEAAASGGVPVNGCAYFGVDNDAARRLSGAQAAWSFQPYRVVLDCEELATVAPGTRFRRAMPSDGERIVELLNVCHDGRELYVPYTEVSLASRLDRAADVYSWSSLLLSDRAVVGTWLAGRTHVKRPKDPAPLAPETTSIRALVLDYGFEPGAEDELEQLLRTVGGEAREAGMTHLSVFTSDASPGSARLRGLASEIEYYELATPYTPEPEGAADRGLYVDQVYF